MKYPRSKIIPGRREFLKSAALLGLGGMVGTSISPAEGETPAGLNSDSNQRIYWVNVLTKIATPVLANLATHQLKETMPIEAANPKDRGRYTHLEAFGRLLSGIAPWLAVQNPGDLEMASQKKFIGLAQ